MSTQPRDYPREATIKRLEGLGYLDPACPGCKQAYEVKDPTSVFGPPHKAGMSCESGKRAHCTCPLCWG